MPRLLMVVSSARTLTLADGTEHPTGYWAEEVEKPYRRFVEQGVEVVVATPDGQPPQPDPYGLEPIFHYPDEDEDFAGPPGQILAAVRAGELEAVVSEHLLDELADVLTRPKFRGSSPWRRPSRWTTNSVASRTSPTTLLTPSPSLATRTTTTSSRSQRPPRPMRIGAPTWLARTRLEWTRMLINRARPGDAERARELLGQALETARELGLANVKRRAVHLLKEQ